MSSPLVILYYPQSIVHRNGTSMYMIILFQSFSTFHYQYTYNLYNVLFSFNFPFITNTLLEYTIDEIIPRNLLRFYFSLISFAYFPMFYVIFISVLRSLERCTRIVSRAWLSLAFVSIVTVRDIIVSTVTYSSYRDRDRHSTATATAISTTTVAAAAVAVTATVVATVTLHFTLATLGRYRMTTTDTTN